MITFERAIKIGAITIDKNTIKLNNKNQIYNDNGLWILEQYEFTDSHGVEMFSVFSDFDVLEDAINFGMRLSDRTHNELINEILSKRESHDIKKTLGYLGIIL